MGYIEGKDRTQSWLLPNCIEDYITEENPIQFIEVFVNELDYAELGFIRAHAKDTGRPGYHPGTLLRRSLYGDLNRIQSSRRLEREASRNLELMWLLQHLQPDFKTIADFRKDNGQAIRAVCREFTLLCKRLDLFGLDFVAIDGSKFKAVNSKDRNFTDKRIALHCERIDQDIERYLTALNKADLNEKSVEKMTLAGFERRVQQLKEEKANLKKLQRQLKMTDDKQISLTDPDARAMATRKSGSKVVGYNVQTAVEPKHHLIIAHEVTHAVTDRSLLYQMATQAKAILGTKTLDVYADSGYYHGKEVIRCLAEHIRAYVPRMYTSRSKNLGRFGKQDFMYDRKKDQYICPAKQRLDYKFTTIEQEREIKYYTTSACKQCKIKQKCTTNKQRRITRWVDENIMDDMEAAIQRDPSKMKYRKQTVEHPFGTIKSWMGSTHFLMKRLHNVKTEMSLHVLAYNIKRAIKVLGVKPLMSAMV